MPSCRSELFAPPSSKPYAAWVAAASSSMDAPSFPLIGDYIGVESCVDYDEPPAPGASVDGGDILKAEPERDRRWLWEPKGKRSGQREEKEYPPPIPLLARTGNLPSHMPWVLRRQYTSDGRLILTEEKVRYHEYFRAHRADGRLTLQLIPLDRNGPYSPMIADDEEEADEDDDDEEEVVNPEAGITIANDLTNRDDDDRRCEVGDPIGEEKDCGKLASSIAELTVESSGSGGGGGGMGGNGVGKCSNYNNGLSMSPSSSCIFGVPVPALRPVHS